jgi:hypothetical protein
MSFEKEKQAFEEIVTNFENYLCNVVGLDIDDFDAFMSEIARRYSDNKNEEIAALKAEIERKDEAILDALVIDANDGYSMHPKSVEVLLNARSQALQGEEE